MRIQNKLILLLAGLASVVLFVVLVIINVTQSERILEKIREDFRRTQAVFQKEQELRYDKLIESASLIGENSVFKANVALGDPNSIYFSVTDFADLVKADLFLVTDAAGILMARLDQPGLSGIDMSEVGGIRMALQGYYPDYENFSTELWSDGAGLYEVASAPVFTRDATILGSITLGTLLTSYEAEQLKGESGIEISFFYRDSLIGTSIDSLKNARHNRLGRAFTAVHRDPVNQVVETGKPSQTLNWHFAGRDFFAFVGPLGNGVEAWYLALTPKDKELAIVNDLQFNIFLTAISSLMLIILIAIVLSRQFSRPILRLVRGMEKVREGDLEVRIQSTSGDEIGLLTERFNQMIIGLQERLKLSRYVGSHTLAMIEAGSSDGVELGGSEKDVTVLFTDVRNFTQFSENKSPQEVIAALNANLGMQAELVDLYGGSVDKFVGDEMLALFAGRDMIIQALRCALQIQKVLRRENASAGGLYEIGIGINCGAVILGNMGAKERMDYTVIGAAVNLGSRLCSAAKAGQILIPAALVTDLQQFVFTPPVTMQFKGITSEIAVVEVLGEK
jgi:class 3 adenylate cyclase